MTFNPGGSGRLSSSDDVLLSSPLDNQVLSYSTSLGKWQNVTANAGLFVNVKNFGALGDGITDDSARIQAAVTALGGAGGGTLFFPDGEYRINDTIVLVSNIHITGSARAVLRKTIGSSNYCVFVGLASNSLGYGGGLHNITITGLTFRGDLGNNKSLSALSIHRADGIYVNDCHFLETSQNGHVFDLMGCQNIIIENSEFRGIKPVVGRGYVEAIQCDSSTASGVGFSTALAAGETFDGTATRNVTVRGCTFGAITVAGVTYAGQSPIGSHSYVDGFFYENIVFEGNRVSDVQTSIDDSYPGVVHFIGAKKVSIRNNYFNGSNIPNTAIRIFSGNGATAWADVSNPSAGVSTPVNWSAPEDIKIEHNHFENFTGVQTIWAYGASGHVCSFFTACHNTFRDCRVDEQNYVIQNTWTNNCLVSGNQLTNCSALVYSGDSSNVIISNNICDVTSWTSINCARAQKVKIAGNIITNGYGPITTSDGSDVTIGDNTVEIAATRAAISLAGAPSGAIICTSNAISSTLANSPVGISISASVPTALIAHNVSTNYTAITSSAAAGVVLSNNLSTT